MSRVTRRAFSLAVLGCATGAIAHANQPAPAVRRVGLLIGDDSEGGVAAFKEALRNLGFVEGRNLAIELRQRQTATADPAAELAKTNVELVVAHSLPLALAMRAANASMPMVVVTTPGFVVNGFAQTLERPGGNITGIDELPPGLTARRLELLKTAAPAVSRVALLSTTPGSGSHEIQLSDAQQAGFRLHVTVKPYRALSIAELEKAFAAIVRDGADGLLNFQDGFSYVNRQAIVDFAARHRLPAIYQATVFAEAGGLMTWAPSLLDQFRTAAEYVAEILKGARPGDLPVRYPTRYYLTINRTAAKNLGLALPAALLADADRLLP